MRVAAAICTADRTLHSISSLQQLVSPFLFSCPRACDEDTAHGAPVAARGRDPASARPLAPGRRAARALGWHLGQSIAVQPGLLMRAGGPIESGGSGADCLIWGGRGVGVSRGLEEWTGRIWSMTAGLWYEYVCEIARIC